MASKHQDTEKDPDPEPREGYERVFLYDGHGGKEYFNVPKNFVVEPQSFNCRMHDKKMGRKYHTDPEAIIRIEHDKDTRTNQADFLYDSLCEILPHRKFKLEIVVGAPKSFEVYCRKVNEAGKGTLVWTGLKIYSWRAKVPEAKAIAPKVEKILM